MLCDICRQRQQRVLTRLAAAVSRGRTIAIDVAGIHPADRKAVARRLTRLAKRTPPGTATILTSLAESLRSGNPLVTCDLTSVDTATIRTVGSVLENELETEIVGAGPDRDVIIAIVASWLEWQRNE